MRRMRHLKPREIQGCQLTLDSTIPGSLYDATSGGSLVVADGAVARWEDQSGNARHVTQSTAGSRPTLRVANVNGNDVVEFESDWLVSSSLNLTTFMGSGTENTALSVLQQLGSDAQNTTWRISGGGGIAFGAHQTYDNVLYYDAGSYVATGRMSVAQPAGWDDAIHVVFGRRSGSNGIIAVDNSTLSTYNSFSDVASSSGSLYVGADDAVPNGALSGKIGVLCFWDRALDDAVMKRLGNAMQRKWRIGG